MKEKLHWIHIAILIFMTQIDITFFLLPRLVAENIGTNGWLGLLFLSALALFNIFLYSLVFRLGKGKSFFEIMEGSLPKLLLFPLYLILALFWIFLGSILGKNFILIYQVVSLPATNPMLLILLFCLPLYFLLIKDIYQISKAVTMFFLLAFWIWLMMPYFIQELDWVNFTSFFFQGVEGGHNVYNWATVFQVFIGYELCLFLFPFVGKNSKLFKGVYLGHLTLTFLYLVVLIISFGFFSFPKLQVIIYPIITMAAYLELPFVNRLESLVLPFFLFFNLTSTVMFCFASLLTVKRIFPRIQPQLMVWVIVALVFAFSFTIENVRESKDYVSKTLSLEMGFAFLCPLLLLLLLRLQQTRERKIKP